MQFNDCHLKPEILVSGYNANVLAFVVPAVCE